MNRNLQVSFVCAQCGHAHRKWAGQCEQCNSWNSLEAQNPTPPLGKTRPQATRAQGAAQRQEFVPLAQHISSTTITRHATGNAEFDRVCGGGLVPGAVILLGGDPGIGKSTLLLQIATACASQDLPSLYVSGEESPEQIGLRAKRLGVDSTQLAMASLTHMEDLLASCAHQKHRYRLLLVDSIQTMWSTQLDGVPGSLVQLRACTQLLIEYAKANGCVVLLVGHVTKDGQIAGPRALEHMVDTVMYFEGDASSGFRLLRSVKNRFGPANEIGVFEMAEQGLLPIANPSEVFLRGRETQQAGAMVFAGLEGTRPVLVEIQALLAPSALATPRRTAQGWDNTRLSMLLAVLETRLGTSFARFDVFLNIAGGLRIHDPAADLAVASALLSALNNVPCPADSVAFGEISLAGSIRPAGQIAARLREAARLGFQSALCAPIAKTRERADLQKILALKPLAHLRDLRHSLAPSA